MPCRPVSCGRAKRGVDTRLPPCGGFQKSRADGRIMTSHKETDVIEVTTATRVATSMFEQGLAQVQRPSDIRAWIEEQLY